MFNNFICSYNYIYQIRFHAAVRLFSNWLQMTSKCGKDKEVAQEYGPPFVSKLWHDIRAFFSHVYLQSFLLHDIRAFFCHVYLRFIPKYITIFLQTRIYMHTKKPIYMRYKQACGICSRRKSLYKRHQIIPSANNSFMYDGAEKYLQFESSMAAMPALILFQARFGSYSLPSQ